MSITDSVSLVLWLAALGALVLVATKAIARISATVAARIP